MKEMPYKLSQLSANACLAKLLVWVSFFRCLNFLRGKSTYIRILNSTPVELFPAANITVIESARTFIFTEPKIFGKMVSEVNREVALPSKRIVELRNVTIIGGYQLVCNGSLIILEKSEDPFFGFVAGTWQYIKVIKNEINKLIAYYDYKRVIKLPHGILLAGRCDKTYFHWLIEYLGRSYILSKSKALSSIPLLVSADMPRSQFDALEAVLPQWPIIKIEPETLLKVDDLTIPSINTYHPDTLDLPFWMTSGVCFDTLYFLQNSIKNFINLNSEKSSTVKSKHIYLSREGASHSGRNIINNESIKKKLLSYGFDVIDPASLSFREQVTLFQEADLIVGAMGSAFTNLIFCNPDTKIIALSSPYTQKFCMQSNLALFAKCQYHILVGQHPAYKDGDEYTNKDYALYAGSFFVDPALLENLLFELGVINLQQAPVSSNITIAPKSSRSILESQNLVFKSDDPFDYLKTVDFFKKYFPSKVYTFLKRNRLIQKYTNYFFYASYQTFYSLSSRIYHLKNILSAKTNSFEIICLKNYCDSRKKLTKVIFGPERLNITLSAIESKSLQPILLQGSKEEFPQIYSAMLVDVIVLGYGSFYCLAEGLAISSDLLEIESDLLHEENHKKSIVDLSSKKVSYINRGVEEGALEEAVSFLSCVSSNYSHWLTEVLPKIAIFCLDNGNKNIPILLNAGLPHSILESAGLIAGLDRRFIFVGQHQKIRVSKLHLISTTGYIPYERRFFSEDPSIRNDRFSGAFSANAIRLMRDSVFQLLSVDDYFPKDLKKIYIRRSSPVRVLINQREIERMLEGLGFFVIEPEKYTFSQQVKIFQNAEFVVSPTGAALANAIFCKPFSRVIVLMAAHPDMIYGYWSNILEPLKVRVDCFVGGQASNPMDKIHSNYSCDVSTLRHFICDLENGLFDTEGR